MGLNKKLFVKIIIDLSLPGTNTTSQYFYTWPRCPNTFWKIYCTCRHTCSLLSNYLIALLRLNNWCFWQKWINKQKIFEKNIFFLFRFSNTTYRIQFSKLWLYFQRNVKKITRCNKIQIVKLSWNKNFVILNYRSIIQELDWDSIEFYYIENSVLLTCIIMRSHCNLYL